MKLTALVVAVLTLAVSTAFPPLALPWVLFIVAAYAAYGILRSTSRKLDYLNDIPNAVRVALAAAGGYLIGAPLNFIIPSAGSFFFVVSLYLNDEYQRRALLAMTEGRRGGSVALLGIDGSGKSTHAARLEKWFLSRGYYSTVVPFHRYLFVERLTRKRGERGPDAGERGGNPLRPLLSLADNIILNLITSLGVGLEGRVVIYDRYIWSTYLKYRSLGYPVEPLSALYMLPRPKLAFVLDVPVTRSMEIIRGRGNHIRYASEVLKEEKEEYLKIAASRGYPVIDSTRDFETVQGELERRLERVFPTARRGRRS
jgi:dTMP kinase